MCKAPTISDQRAAVVRELYMVRGEQLGEAQVLGGRKVQGNCPGGPRTRKEKLHASQLRRAQSSRWLSVMMNKTSSARALFSSVRFDKICKCARNGTNEFPGQHADAIQVACLGWVDANSATPRHQLAVTRGVYILWLDVASSELVDP